MDPLQKKMETNVKIDYLLGIKNIFKHIHFC